MPATRILVCWIGNTDLKAAEGKGDVGLGPIAQAVQARQFDSIVLLCDHSKDVAATYKKWLTGFTQSAIEVRQHRLPAPTDFGEIYRAATDVLAGLREAHGANVELTFHLSPGTPAMAAVWILLAKTRFPAELIESSREQGVRTAQVPFDISAEFIPDLLRRSDERMARLAQGVADEAPEFAAIIHRSPQMKRVIEQAQRVAIRSVPVLIEGESGTGKELLARAIHTASPRAGKPFITVNCGAIPSELVESEFFGHKKGAFTGAGADRAGHFEQASGGTLFLDEIESMPLAVQVKLLRVLESRQITPLGSNEVRSLDLRVVAATKEDLGSPAIRAKFREDLFYRLNVVTIRIPPLRERREDIPLLLAHYLGHASRRFQRDIPDMPADIKRHLLTHDWPGNVRELAHFAERFVLGVLNTPAAALPEQESTPGTLPEKMERFEAQLIREALAAHQGDVRATLEALGIPRKTFYDKLQRHGIDRQDYTGAASLS